ncbi:BREX-3 system P-loop-containing protein BrxF [Acinetobacter baumannii]|nr:BREX-3 system P-loop-containing protein BrxF [Acinetobacter baumannii]MDQ9853118.1 BREX-3 system P-loop-containing protein BrxF [Acinetobacter baumannii]
MLISNEILNQLASLHNKRDRLCLFINYQEPVNSPNLGEIPFINVGQQLSEKLLMLPQQERSTQASLFFSEIIRYSSSELVGLSRLEILFNRDLAIDPLKLLRENAKEKTILALWPGHFDHKMGLTYAQPNHSEYRLYKPQDIKDLLIIEF